MAVYYYIWKRKKNDGKYFIKCWKKNLPLNSITEHIFHNNFVFVFFFLFLSCKLKRVIKDERFSVGIEPEDDSLWLPAQLLRTTSSVLVQGSWATEETLVNILRLFLAMACSPSCTLNGRLLIEILSKCGDYLNLYFSSTRK